MLQGVVRVIMTLQIKRGSPSISARSGFNLRGSPSPISVHLGFNLKRISLETKPRTNQNGCSLNAPNTTGGAVRVIATIQPRGSPSIFAHMGFNLRGSPSNSANQRGSPSILGSSGPRTVQTQKTTERRRSLGQIGQISASWHPLSLKTLP
jgi:hypothetical protein